MLRRLGIALAGANSGADGRLTAWDVSALDLSRTEVVVLPASTDAEPTSIVGLARTFLLAGARAVIWARWEASDKARRQLLEEFYRRLRDGQECWAALHEAQQALRTTHPDPADWSGFNS
jgi:CHAT domain-containing protein